MAYFKNKTNYKFSEKYSDCGGIVKPGKTANGKKTDKMHSLPR